MGRDSFVDYDEETTARCERALVTLLGDIGPWSQRVYLAGGLAPRYLIGRLPPGAPAHVGTTDVDLVIGLALGDSAPETYRTLETNLKRGGFSAQTSFRWTRRVDDAAVIVEFLCETEDVGPGRIFKPKGESLGSGLGAFNVRGAQLLTADYVEVPIEAERLDDGSRSRVTVRVANTLPYAVLKIFAFQDRHQNKDAYDLVFVLLNSDGGPRAAGAAVATSPIIGHPQVRDGLVLLAERFADANQDGPAAYANFLTTPDDDAAAQLRQQAVATVRAFLTGVVVDPPA